jgi:hypothetical protein
MSETSAFDLGARVRVTAKGHEQFGETGEIVDFSPVNDGAQLVHVKLDDGPTMMMQTGQLKVIPPG